MHADVADVTLTSPQLVFPEKRVLVQPYTLLQLGITAASAAGAGAYWLIHSPPSSFTLVIAWSVLSVFAAKVRGPAHPRAHARTQ
jgi:hypothetical protein